VGAAGCGDDPGAEPGGPAALRPVLSDPVLAGAGAGAAGGGAGRRLHLPPAQEQSVQLSLPERRRPNLASHADADSKVGRRCRHIRRLYGPDNGGLQA
jgi:hypothetical protein